MMSYKDEFFSVLSQFNEYASEAIDKLGYGFLAECGYKVDKAIRYPNERRKLLKKLKKYRKSCALQRIRNNIPKNNRKTSPHFYGESFYCFILSVFLQISSIFP